MKRMVTILGVMIIICAGMIFWGCGDDDEKFTIPFSTGGTIQGVVMKEDTSSSNSPNRVFTAPSEGRTCSGCRVHIEQNDYETKTDEDGNFEITDVEPGHYNLIAEEVRNDGTKQKNQTGVDVIAGQVEDLGRILIKDVGSIYGLIILSDGGDSLGASCFVPGTTMVSLAESGGAYAIGDVAEGTYSVSCCKALYVCETASGISVLAGQAAEVADLSLDPEPANNETVSGTVKDKSGNTISGAVVTAAPETEGIAPQTTQTDVNGGYSLALEPGEYNLIASRGEAYEISSQKVTIVAGEPQVVNITLERNPGVNLGKLSGTVKDEDGNPVASVVIVTNPPMETKFTDNQGHFQILNVLPLSYQVTASKGGYKSSTKTVYISSGQEISIDITISKE